MAGIALVLIWPSPAQDDHRWQPSGVEAAAGPGYKSFAPIGLVTSNGVPPLALGIYRNEFPNDLSRVNEYERTAGKQLAIVHWFSDWNGWKSEFNRADLEAV